MVRSLFQYPVFAANRAIRDERASSAGRWTHRRSLGRAELTTDHGHALRAAEQGATGSDHPGEGKHDQRMNRQFERMALQYRKAVFRSSGALPEEAVMIGRAMHSAPRWRGPWR